MLTRIHYYLTGPAEQTFCLGIISWTCFRSELTCKAADTDKCVRVCKSVCLCEWRWGQGLQAKGVFMSQLNDIAILQPGAHLKARSSSKLQHSRDHCLVVASDMPTFFFFFFVLKDRSFQLFCLLPWNGLAQLFPRAQFVSGCKDCVRLLDI